MPKNLPPLTADRLRERLSYDQDTGVFRWLHPVAGLPAGTIAGVKDRKGYIQITVDGRRYFAHRLAWLYVHGAWPTNQLDHRYGITDDNRIGELREATHAQNHQNEGMRKSNTSGHPGVCWDKRKRKWQVQIRVPGKNKFIGLFSDLGKAVEARAKAKAELHAFQPYDRGAK